MIQRLTRAILALSLAGTVTLPVSGFTGEPHDDRAEAPAYVIVYPGDAATTENGIFYPTGKIADHTIVVVAEADGSLPGGITETQLQVALSSRSDIPEAVAHTGPREPVEAVLRASHAYTAGFSWTSPYDGANIWGWDDHTTVSYTFSVTEGSNQKAGGQGLGYYRGYNGSEFGIWANWYGLGTAQSGSLGGATVPWGAVVATAQFRAISLAPPHIATGYFTP